MEKMINVWEKNKIYRHGNIKKRNGNRCIHMPKDLSKTLKITYSYIDKLIPLTEDAANTEA